MPLFISDDEFRLISHDSSAVAERADAFIRDIRRQLDTVHLESDAASIATEQTCSLLEQKYESLYSEFSRIQSENAQLSTTIELKITEFADVQNEKHQLNIKTIEKNREIERLSVELAEMQKSKRQLLEVIEMKDDEIREKNSTIQSYLDKIILLMENNSSKEARVLEAEAELGRSRAAYNRITQEKELIEKHNTWLNEELDAKLRSLAELRRTHMDIEADLSSKLTEKEKLLTESSASLNWSKERVKELESRVNLLEKELHSSKEKADSNEERLNAELSTAGKLVELYKASSEEWSKKSGELEGAIKALETHLGQVENDYESRLEKEISARKVLEKEAVDLKEKLEKLEAEIENSRKTGELSLLPRHSFQAELNPEISSIEDNVGAIINGNSDMIGPRVPKGVSGTALAASLLRDGWSLVKMYEKYQETYDAFVHESQGRRELENILNQVHHMIEEKVEMISEERAEHERMVEAYSLLDQKLQDALLEYNSLEDSVRRLKAEVKMHQRNYIIAQQEINDLQKQVTILLKECQDVQLRCGTSATNSLTETPPDSFDAADAVSEHLLTFKDIDGLVEQNVHLRRLVHTLSIQEQKRNDEMNEDFQMQLQKVTEEATAKVEAVLKRSEEQASMIESLHTSVAMYKRLYDEERKARSSTSICTEASLEESNKELIVTIEGSQDTSKKLYDQLSEHAKKLEQELSASRSEIVSLRSQRDKVSLEATFAKERLDSFIKEFDRQRQEANAVSARNVELSNLIVDYQKRLRECSDSLQASEENLRKLSMEVSILKHEKEIVVQSEKRASDEVRSLSERVYRLQSSLDTIQNTEEARENARANERRKHEEYLKRVERDWMEAKNELQEERQRVRSLTLEKDKAIENSVRQVEEIRKELADAWRAVASAETRAAVSEARCIDLESKVKAQITKTGDGLDQSVSSTNEVNGELKKTKDDLEKLKEEAKANKEHMLQYKDIAQVNEIALKQMESAHEEYTQEAEKVKKTLKDEVQSLQNKIQELEDNFKLKSEDFASLVQSKEHALSLAMSQASSLREELQEKISHIELLEVQVFSLKDDVDKEHKRWRTSQDNYERQIVLQSETIQELTKTSKELSALQSEIIKLKELSEGLKTENDLLKKTWEKEKEELEHLKYEADRKYNEVNDQNKLLHNRLETLHIRLAEKDHTSTSSSYTEGFHADSDLQSIVGYLRRSKEIAETEISLLKQENSRLRSQLEGALKASESAQASLRTQYENSRSLLFKDEEFKSLQLQVKEINLLRESNMQLRAESKHNFEECQKFREEAQKAKMEAEKHEHLLREKEKELDAYKKEVEILNIEIGSLKSKMAELREATKNLDVEEYERMKGELKHVKNLLRESESEVEMSKRLISEKQESIASLEQTLAKCQTELIEVEKKLNDALQAEATTKAEIERIKRMSSTMKKRYESTRDALTKENEILAKEKETLKKEKETLTKEKENLTREKEDLLRKNQALQKQIEDSKLSRRNIGESSSEQIKKDQEKDTRIQMLEKTLERRNEELKKEKDDNKLRRSKDQSIVVERFQKIKEDKEKLEAELGKHNHAIAIILERSGLTAELPSTTNLDEQTRSYIQSIKYFRDFVDSTINQNAPQSTTTDQPTGDASITSHSGREVTSQQPIRMSAPQSTKGTVGKSEKRPSSSKPVTSGARRPRLVRPPLSAEITKVSATEQSSTTVTEKIKPTVNKMEPSTNEERKVNEAENVIPPNASSLASSARKRPAVSSILEPNKDASDSPDGANDEMAPSIKKSKNTESSIVNEGSSDIIPSDLPSSETRNIVQQEFSLDSLEQPVSPAEHIEPVQDLAASTNDEIADEEKADEDKTVEEKANEEKADEDKADEDKADEEMITNVKEETDEQMKESSFLAEPNEEDGDHQDEEGDTVMMDDEIEMDAANDEEPLREDAKEDDALVADEAENEEEEDREEGEMTPDDSNDLEQQDQDQDQDREEENAASGDEEGEIGEESEKEDGGQADDKLEDVDATNIEEVALPEGTEQVDDGNNEDDGPPGSTQSNSQATDTPPVERSPQKSDTARERSPAPSQPQSSVTERQRSPSPIPDTTSAAAAAEAEESAAQARVSGRTISLSDRARENARLRQARMPVPTPSPPLTPPRGRGRVTRGARGTRGRGGRG